MMATILHNRLRAEFPNTTVNVVKGTITAEARRASGLGNLPFIQLEGKPNNYKNRLDRRHHAVDAAIIALIRPYTAQVLEERRLLREESHELGSAYRVQNWGEWKDHTGTNPEHKAAFGKWRRQADLLHSLLLSAFADDAIPVRQSLRLSRTDGAIHKDTVYPLATRKVSDSLTVDEIDASAIPGQWCALTRLPDYDPKKGLPADPERQISINGRHLKPDDVLEFFTGTGTGAHKITPKPALRVRNGWVACGDFHHLRIYKVPDKKGFTYHAMRVFHVDLPHKGDLFSYELSPQSLSVRNAPSKLRVAFEGNNAEYITWLTKKDELLLDPKCFTGAIKVLSDAVPGGIHHWVLVGFESPNQLKVKPRYLSKEGILLDGKKVKPNCYSPELEAAIKTVFVDKGGRPTIDRIAKTGFTVIRRDALGRARVNSKSGLPQTFTFREE